MPADWAKLLARLAPHLGWAAGLALTAFLAGCGIVGARLWHVREGDLERCRDQWRELAQGNFWPSEPNLAALREELAAIRSSLAALRQQSLRAPDLESALAAPPPSTPTEALIELAGFAREARLRAAEAGIEVNGDETLGFADFAAAGPEADEIEFVHRQKQVVRWLLQRLFSAGPASLLQVRRQSAGCPDCGESAGSSLDARTERARPAGETPEAGSFAVRFRFTGRTSVLRSFLNSMGEGGPELVVREVEVEPHENAWLAALDGSTPVDSAALPVLRPALSVFTVSLKMLRPAHGGALTDAF